MTAQTHPQQTAASSQTLFAINAATVVFGSLVAVRNISFSLRGGDLLGLIGPNGAGKTTLLRAAAGLQLLTHGDVRIMDMNLNGDRAVLQHVGFTPDTPPLYEQLTVRQFLRFIAMGYHLDGSEVDERIDFWLEKVWLTEKANQKIKQLSRGMRQRVGIARTLLPNPAVILLDEPAAGLDPAGRAQFRQLLCSLREQGKTLIVSSHILADMEEYCTHIGIMTGGQMLQFGTVAEISHLAQGDGCRYTVLLAHPIADAASRLNQIPNLTRAQVDGDRIVLDYAAGRDAAASLLSALIRLDLPVASFTPNTASLEEAYLRTGIGQVD